MKSVSFKVLALCMTLALAACNSSSNSNGGSPSQPKPSTPAEVDLQQLDGNESVTEPLSANEEAVVYETLTDIGRANYLSSKSQEKNSPVEGDGDEAGKMTKQMQIGLNKNPQTAKQVGFFDQELLAQNVLNAINQQQLCNPKVTNQKDQSSSVTKFSTSGVQCPMVMEVDATALSTGAGPGQTNIDVQLNGSMKFAMNEAAMPGLQNQDLKSGSVLVSATMKLKVPSETDRNFNQSGKGKFSGTLVSKRLGLIEFSQTMIFASAMDLSGNQGGTGITARSVAQIEMKAAGKHAVLTVKMDSASTPSTTCSLNKKSIALAKCQQIIDQMDLETRSGAQAPDEDGGSNDSLLINRLSTK